MTGPVDPCDVANWERARAEYKNPAGDSAAQRSINASAAVQRMYEIEARWESRPGGFGAMRDRYKEHVKRIVDDMPPLTNEQLTRLAVLLQP